MNGKALRVVEDSEEEGEEEEDEEEEDDSLPVGDSSFDVSLSASDDYMEDEDPSSDESESAPTPPRTTSRKSVGSVRSIKAKEVILPEIDYEEVVELQTRVARVSLGAEVDENEAGEEDDDMVAVLKVKKPKRYVLLLPISSRSY